MCYYRSDTRKKQGVTVIRPKQILKILTRPLHTIQSMDGSDCDVFYT